MKILLLLFLTSLSALGQTRSPEELLRRAVWCEQPDEEAVENVKLALQLPDLRKAAAEYETDAISYAMKALSGISWEEFRPGSARFQRYVELDEQQAGVLTLLLDAGAKNCIPKYEKEKETPLMFATSVGAIDCTRVLLDAGADVNGRGKGKWTPLMCAADKIWRHSALVELLISRGAKADYVNPDGESALTLAFKSCIWGECDMVEQGSKQGCENAKRGTLAGIRALLKAKANPSPAMPIAISQGWAEGVDLLIKAGASTDKAMETLIRAKIDGKVKDAEFEAVKAVLQKKTP